MPKGTKVERVYQKVKAQERAKGNPDAEGKAARIAQAVTGQSLATGRAPKHRGK